MCPFLVGGLDMRSQDLEPAWVLNGSVYIISPERLRSEKTFLTADAKPIIVHKKSESLISMMSMIGHWQSQFY